MQVAKLLSIAALLPAVTTSCSTRRSQPNTPAVANAPREGSPSQEIVPAEHGTKELVPACTPTSLTDNPEDRAAFQRVDERLQEFSQTTLPSFSDKSVAKAAIQELQKQSGELLQAFSAIADKRESVWSRAAVVRMGDVFAVTAKKIRESPIPEDVHRLQKKFPDQKILGYFTEALITASEPFVGNARKMWERAEEESKRICVDDKWSALAAERLRTHPAPAPKPETSRKPQAPAKPTPSSDPSTVPTCRGDNIDLVAAERDCEVDKRSRALPPSVKMEIAPNPLVLGKGQAAGEVELVLRNTSDALLSLDIDNSCGGFLSENVILDKKDKRADLRFVGDCSKPAMLCMASAVHIELFARGSARLPVRVSARRNRYQRENPQHPISDCVEKEGPRLPRGTYRLKVGVRFAEESPEATLILK